MENKKTHFYRLDLFLQRWRIRKAIPYIKQGAKVLDIGCWDGVLFRMLGEKLGYGVGIDPLITPEKTANYALYEGYFPQDLPEADAKGFDAITMLAVLEHIPAEILEGFVKACYDSLHIGGVIIITVPDTKVDYIISLLQFLRLSTATSFEEHYGYDIRQTRPILEKAGFQLVKHKKFQLGLNNLFVFRKGESR